MRLDAIGDWIIAIPMLHVAKLESGIILPSTNKGTSRCYLIEGVSDKAKAAGFGPGQIIVAVGGRDLVFYGGVFVRTVIDLRANDGNNVIMRMSDVGLDEFTTVDGKPILEVMPETSALAASAAAS